MRTLDIRPYARAIAEQLCRPCDEGDDRGVCCRPGGDPCALTAHADVVVEAVTSLGRGKTPDEYSRALERGMCPHCNSAETGYCSLLELMIDVPDEKLLRIVEVVMDVHDRAGGGSPSGT